MADLKLPFQPWGLIVALWTAGRLYVAARSGLAADEAYYWCWSEQLAFGYFDHPPMVAWMIRLGTTIFGDTEIGVRFVGILLEGLLLGLMEGRARWLLLAAPAMALGGLLATPDLPLLLAWVLVLRSRDPWITGLGLGVAVLSKLTGWLLFPALILGGRRDWRPLALGAALSLPNWIWNAQNGFPSWTFQLEHGFGGGNGGLGPLLELWAGCFVLGGPLLPLAVVGWLWAARRERDATWWSAILVLGLFSVAALRSRGEANWLAPALVAGLLGLDGATGRLARLADLGAWLGGALSFWVAVHAVHPLADLPKDPVDQLRMGPWLGDPVSAWGYAPVLAPRYQEAAWIRFYGRVDATTVPGVGRVDQFDLWRGDAALPERTIVVRPQRASTAWDTDALYPQRGGVSRVTARRDERVIQTWEILEVWQ